MNKIKISDAPISDAQSHGSHPSGECDSIVQECLKYIYTTPDDHDAMERVLSCLGTCLACDRASLFLVRDGYWISTEFEWLGGGATPLKDRIKNEPYDSFSWCDSFFKAGRAGVICNTEDVRAGYPAAYALLRSRHTVSAAALPVRVDGTLAGVLALGNPNPSKVTMAQTILDEICSYLKPLVKRLNTVKQLEVMSFHDPLTGALNRNALMDLYHHPLAAASAAVIFCDISGLKSVNDTEGHEAGDKMIIQCYRLIQKTLRTDRIYRMGGDEFLALYCGETRENVYQDFLTLKHEAAMSQHHIAVGCRWSDEAPLMLEPLIAAADQEMYADKQRYYSTRDHFAHTSKVLDREQEILQDIDENSPFQQYLEKYFFDPETLIKSLTINNTNQFFYFGDIRTNYYYISDQMRDRFGFESNILLNLPHYWEQCICDEEYKKMNSVEVELLFGEKRSSYELLHRLEDVRGNRFWAHNSGCLLWNKDRTVPLFMSGRITMHDKDYSVDQITGFQKDNKALTHLEELQRDGRRTHVIGFCLNHFPKLNQNGATYKGNMLLYHIGSSLLTRLRSKLTFYRLDDVYFMAVIAPEFSGERLALINEIRTIIGDEYKAAEVFDKNPVNFALLPFARSSKTAQEFMELVNDTIDTAKDMPNLPYVSISGEKKREIAQNEHMLSTLHKNVQNNMENFRIIIQPAVHAGTEVPAGGEALLRWKYNGQDVLPSQLLPLLEREGLLDRVDRWVIEQTVAEGALLKECAKDFILTFNISNQVLESNGFAMFLEQTLQRYGMDEHPFYAELYEMHILAYAKRVDEFLKVCRKLRISITQKGFASATALFHAGLSRETNVLKLSVPLIRAFGTPEEQMKVLQSLVHLCHSFGKKICVTQVEDEEINDMVVASGCDYIEGYYHYGTMELQELYEILVS